MGIIFNIFPILTIMTGLRILGMLLVIEFLKILEYKVLIHIQKEIKRVILKIICLDI
jgi:hypothetical protein